MLPNPVSIARSAATSIESHARDHSRTLASAGYNLLTTIAYASAESLGKLAPRFSFRIEPPENVKPVVMSAQYEIYEGFALLQDAIASKGWHYPLQGLFYITARPHFYRAIRRELLISVSISAGVFVYMILTAYLQQVEWLSKVAGPLGSILAVPLVLAEIRILTNAILHLAFIEIALDNLFDATLVEHGQNDLVLRGRALRPSRSDPRVQELGMRTTPPRMHLSPSAVMGAILLLPLNIIPVVGILLYSVYNGWQAGPSYHGRYFELKRMVSHEGDLFAARRQAAYTAFGATDILLGFIPVVGPLAVFSSTVGAALWAAQMERRSRTALPPGTAFPPPVARVVFGPDSRSSEGGM